MFGPSALCGPGLSLYRAFHIAHNMPCQASVSVDECAMFMIG